MKILSYVFGAGWVIDNLGYLFLSRDWNDDKSRIYFIAKQYLEGPSKLLLFIFPEGTAYSPQKLERSLKVILT